MRIYKVIILFQIFTWLNIFSFFIFKNSNVTDGKEVILLLKVGHHDHVNIDCNGNERLSLISGVVPNLTNIAHL